MWSLVGILSPKDKTQLEERLRRVAGPSTTDLPEATSAPTSGPVSRLTSGIARPGSRIGGIPRPASPVVASSSRLARPASPARSVLPSSPVTAHDEGRSRSPALVSKLPKTNLAGPSSPRIPRPKSFLPSRLGPSRNGVGAPTTSMLAHIDEYATERPVLRTLNGDQYHHPAPVIHDAPPPVPDDLEDAISLTISKILSSDATRSVDALKTVQKILEIHPEEGPSSPQYRELSDHTEGLIETITLQMNHVFEGGSTVTEPENFRLAKHLIQTINAFCDHPVLAESLQVDILTSLFEELTLRLLQTDESDNSKVKDLSRFINMIILRLFATCRRMAVLRYVFFLLRFAGRT